LVSCFWVGFVARFFPVFVLDLFSFFVLRFKSCSPCLFFSVLRSEGVESPGSSLFVRVVDICTFRFRTPGGRPPAVLPHSEAVFGPLMLDDFLVARQHASR